MYWNMKWQAALYEKANLLLFKTFLSWQSYSDHSGPFSDHECTKIFAISGSLKFDPLVFQQLQSLIMKVYYSLNSSIYFSMSSPFSRPVKYENSWRLQSRSLEHLIETVRRWGWHISFTNQSIGGVSPSVILHIARQLSISSKYSRA